MRVRVIPEDRPLVNPIKRDQLASSSLAVRLAAAFGLAAAIAIAFNTVLAWTKDAFEPLNAFMAGLTGHHWITHGLAEVVLFLVLGAGLSWFGRPRQLSGALTIGVAGTAVVAGAGLALWFVLF